MSRQDIDPDQLLIDLAKNERKSKILTAVIGSGIIIGLIGLGIHFGPLHPKDTRQILSPSQTLTQTPVFNTFPTPEPTQTPVPTREPTKTPILTPLTPEIMTKKAEEKSLSELITQFANSINSKDYLQQITDAEPVGYKESAISEQKLLQKISIDNKINALKKLQDKDYVASFRIPEKESRLLFDVFGLLIDQEDPALRWIGADRVKMGKGIYVPSYVPKNNIYAASDDTRSFSTVVWRTGFYWPVDKEIFLKDKEGNTKGPMIIFTYRQIINRPQNINDPYLGKKADHDAYFNKLGVKTITNDIAMKAAFGQDFTYLDPNPRGEDGFTPWEGIDALVIEGEKPRLSDRLDLVLIKILSGELKIEVKKSK